MGIIPAERSAGSRSAQEAHRPVQPQQRRGGLGLRPVEGVELAGQARGEARAVVLGVLAAHVEHRHAGVGEQRDGRGLDAPPGLRAAVGEALVVVVVEEDHRGLVVGEALGADVHPVLQVREAAVVQGVVGGVVEALGPHGVEGRVLQQLELVVVVGEVLRDAVAAVAADLPVASATAPAPTVWSFQW
jgi:hypothetical protein